MTTRIDRKGLKLPKRTADIELEEGSVWLRDVAPFLRFSPDGTAVRSADVTHHAGLSPIDHPDGSITTAKLATLDHYTMNRLTTDPTLIAGRIWFRNTAPFIRFSPDGTTVRHADVTYHAGLSPIDHPDGSITTAKIGDSQVTPAKLSFGTWEKIAEVTLTSDVGTIDFTGLNINVDKVYYIYAMIRNPYGYYKCYKMFVEGDYSEANYYNQQLYLDGGTVSATRANSADIGGLSAYESGFFRVVLTLDPRGYMKFQSMVTRDTGSAVKAWMFFGSNVAVKSNITSIRLSTDVGAPYGAGSTIILARPKTK